jgi:hypothetical protein
MVRDDGSVGVSDGTSYFLESQFERKIVMVASSSLNQKKGARSRCSCSRAKIRSQLSDRSHEELAMEESNPNWMPIVE